MDEVAQLSIFSKHAGCEDADDQGVVCDAALISIYGTYKCTIGLETCITKKSK